jgi:parallel beta-helix repeat protein
VNETASVSPSTATIQVGPKEGIDAIVCTSFEINVKVTNATDLKQFTLRLPFNNTLLWVLGARNGAQNASNLEEFKPLDAGLWNGTGEIRVYGRFYNAVKDETLAIIEFKCQKAGECDLNLDKTTKLLNSALENIDYTLGPPCRCRQVTSTSKPIEVNQNLTLCSDLSFFGQLFFNIIANDIVLDLNGFTISSQQSRTGTAIQAFGVNNVCIKNGVIAPVQTGFKIQNCRNVKIINVTVDSAYYIGVEIHWSSNLTIIDSTIRNTQSGEGIWLESCSWVDITNNLISENKPDGICLDSSNNCTISKNTIMYNNEGISLKNSFQNTIFNNNFVQNKMEDGRKCNAVGIGSRNVWNSYYPYGGNYWDDFADQMINDSVSGMTGKNRTILGCDGIGDTPYQILGDTQDEYPLLYPFNASKLRVFDIPLKVSCLGLTETRSLLTAIFGNFTDIGNFDFSKTEKGGLISFSIYGGTFCNVIVPRELLDGPFSISVDHVTAPSTSYFDTTHNFAGISYGGPSHKVEIATKITGDINGDGKVNILDITIVATHWYLTVEKP